MDVSSDQVSKESNNKELYAYNPANRFRIYERNINSLIYYKFFPEVFKDKVIESLKNLKIPMEVEQNDTGWIRVTVADEHKDDPAIKEMVSNIGNSDVEDYYEKKSKIYAAKGWQVVVRNIK